MSLKASFSKEMADLKTNKRPYETAAFIIFMVLLIQQVGLLLVRFIGFIQNGWFGTGNLTTPGFFARIITIDNNSWAYVILGLLAFVIYYVLIYKFVYRYCAHHGYAKWTWTLIVAFGPNILLTSPYYIYALYVFRPYVFRFVKRIVEEFKAYDPKQPFKEEQDDSEKKTTVKTTKRGATELKKA